MSNKIDKEFDEKFEEDFFNLHYIFCKFSDKETTKTCRKMRKDVKEDIKKFYNQKIKALMSEIDDCIKKSEFAPPLFNAIEELRYDIKQIAKKYNKD